jgi:FtsP/CotA-like multicopper oxidase with cupredoxin domain
MKKNKLVPAFLSVIILAFTFWGGGGSSDDGGSPEATNSAIRSAFAADMNGVLMNSDPPQELSPEEIPKYETPLIIPPVMPPTGQGGNKAQNGRASTIYQIAVRQFRQQILPTGYPMTTVWSYGSALDPRRGPRANESFNYPAFTMEARTNQPVRVRWINDLVDDEGDYLRHILPVDPTLHWANPPMDCIEGDRRTDCRGEDQSPYTGPVPIVVHLHGAHTDDISDGYPEAWWLPKAKNIPAGYATRGSNYGSVIPAAQGSAWFEYDNSQPAATLWFHDHALGITRLNVYAGPAGFYLLRDDMEDSLGLPGPAATQGETVADLNTPGSPVRAKIREIPIAIQDRSFNTDGSLSYPDNRAFFEGVEPEDLDITFIPETSESGSGSDVSPIWNPEFFGNTMVVNGRTWPRLEVEPDLYRFRYLNGCNSRFLILRAAEVTTGMDPDNPSAWKELADEFHQIGADGGLLPNVASLDELLMGPAERADVIMDFRNFAPGTRIVLLNIAPDEPFGGGTPGQDFDPADPETTGQVMLFEVVADTDHGDQFDAIPVLPGIDDLSTADNTRYLSLNEEESAAVCVLADEETDEFIVPIEEVPCDSTDIPEDTEIVPFGPIAALLGTMDENENPEPRLWADAITETPLLDDIENWQIANFTEDAHPIHIHMVLPPLDVQAYLITRAVRRAALFLWQP